MLGEFACFDRVETAPAHRRRGLADFIMRRLAWEAFAAGARIGLLAATTAGRATYQPIGWRVVAPWITARRKESS